LFEGICDREKGKMVSMVKQSNVLVLFLFCTLIFNSSDGAKSDFGVTSVPPSCVNKCQGCTPCVRVLVTLPPSSAASAAKQTDSVSRRPVDDNPAVWRCKCGGKLYPPQI